MYQGSSKREKEVFAKGVADGKEGKTPTEYNDVGLWESYNLGYDVGSGVSEPVELD